MNFGRTRVSSPWVDATGLALVVALPALFARPWADERVYVYWPEQIAGRNPLLLLVRVLEEIPGYLQLGVFRWLSRLVTFLENWVILRASLAVGLPVNVVRAIPKALMVLALATVLVATLRQYRQARPHHETDRSWTVLMGTTAVVFAASLTIFRPSTHPLTLFPSLYLGTAAVALGIPLMLGRMKLNEHLLADSPRSLGVLRGTALAAMGIGIASMIELAYLALPLSIVHLALLDRCAFGSQESRERTFLSSLAVRAWLMITGGFLVVFIPIRVVIARICSNGGCYQAAAPGFTLDLLEVWPRRLLSGAFPVMQYNQRDLVADALRANKDLFVIGLMAAAFASWLLWRSWAIEREAVPSRHNGWMGAAALYFGVVLVLATGLASLSREVQQQDLGLTPWRESGFSWVAWTGLVAVVVTVAIQRLSHLPQVGLAVVLVAAVLMASVQNQADMLTVRSQPEGRLHNQIAASLADFDRSDRGNMHRCAITNELLAFPEAEPNRFPFLVGLLDAVAINHYGLPFCSPSEAT